MMNFKQSKFLFFLRFLNNEYKCDEEIDIAFVDEYLEDFVKIDIVNNCFTVYTKYKNCDYKNVFYKIAFKYILMCQMLEKRQDKIHELICDADNYSRQVVQKYFSKNI